MLNFKIPAYHRQANAKSNPKFKCQKPIFEI
jgi:hypothetical protein